MTTGGQGPMGKHIASSHALWADRSELHFKRLLRFHGTVTRSSKHTLVVALPPSTTHSSQDHTAQTRKPRSPPLPLIKAVSNDQRYVENNKQTKTRRPRPQSLEVLKPGSPRDIEKPFPMLQTVHLGVRECMS